MSLSNWMRFFIYGAYGVCFEIIFTGIKHWIASGYKDWSFRGKSYIWMFPIYGLLVFFFEPIHNALRESFWLARGLLYVAGLYVVEFSAGWLLRKVTGNCPWDYTGKKYNFMGLIRWNYAPIWFFFTMAAEPLHDLLMRIRI